MGWESSGVVGFDLGPLLQGQTRIVNLFIGDMYDTYTCPLQPCTHLTLKLLTGQDGCHGHFFENNLHFSTGCSS